mmetsp:Transcript_4938/g.12140  ORF Transcript_4938/g.12140 Transcript_4938/m.12140 type:complete len:88 (+) Transcript_4938:672-935(+)
MTMTSTNSHCMYAVRLLLYYVHWPSLDHISAVRKDLGAKHASHGASHVVLRERVLCECVLALRVMQVRTIASKGLTAHLTSVNVYTT